MKKLKGEWNQECYDMGRRNGFKEANELCDKLAEALEQSELAIDDWLNIHASSECDAERVKEAWDRISSNSGTIAYIAKIQAINREALALYNARKRKG